VRDAPRGAPAYEADLLDPWNEPDPAPGIRNRRAPIDWIRRHPAASVSMAAAAVLAAVIGFATFAVDALRTNPGLRITSPQALVALLRTPATAGWSGTAVSQVTMGLSPAAARTLAATIPAGAQLTGLSTLRFWYGGPGAERIALARPTSEDDVVRQGRRLWLWDTGTQVARRVTLPSATGPIPLAFGTAASLTPPTLAAALVDSLGSDSDVTLRSGPSVADRPTYELVLRPDVAGSLISAIHIDVDGDHGVALAVRIYAGDGSLDADADGVEGALALDTSFSSVWFAAPSPRNFRFQPPPGATVLPGTSLGVLSSDNPDATVLGSGWLQVVSFAPDAERAALMRVWAAGHSRAVSGAWGSGRVMRTPLLSMVVTRTDRVVIGPVGPAELTRVLPALPPRPKTSRPPQRASARSATAGSPRPRRPAAR
jgi:outer membrane lipoprotein-sorting protein